MPSERDVIFLIRGGTDTPNISARISLAGGIPSEEDGSRKSKSWLGAGIRSLEGEEIRSAA